MKIVMLERNSLGTDIDISCFEELGEFVQYPVTVAEETPEKIKDADILIANKTPMNEAALKDAKNIKMICETSTGVDNVDMEYVGSRGIAVANIKNYSTAAVAQHTFALAFYLLEHLPFYDDYVKSGKYGEQLRFSNFDLPFFELEGKTWGIIGMGNIGKRVAGIALAFGCRVIHYSTSGNPGDGNHEQVTFDTLLKESDMISIHCPLTDKTHNLMDAKAFDKMKKTAILINVARGPIVNDEDLYMALTRGKIAGAGLDVLGKEPISLDNPLNAIKDSNKLIITPHMAWASTEARTRCVEETYQNVAAFLRGEERNIMPQRK